MLIMVIYCIKKCIRYWSEETRCDGEKERLEGLTHSILCIFDGCNGDFKYPIDIVVDGKCINEYVHMHEEIWRN
jgi:hypothetical protein